MEGKRKRTKKKKKGGAPSTLTDAEKKSGSSRKRKRKKRKGAQGYRGERHPKVRLKGPCTGKEEEGLLCGGGEERELGLLAGEKRGQGFLFFTTEKRGGVRQRFRGEGGGRKGGFYFLRGKYSLREGGEEKQRSKGKKGNLPHGTAAHFPDEGAIE